MSEGCFPANVEIYPDLVAFSSGHILDHPLEKILHFRASALFCFWVKGPVGKVGVGVKAGEEEI